MSTYTHNWARFCLPKPLNLTRLANPNARLDCLAVAAESTRALVSVAAAPHGGCAFLEAGGDWEFRPARPDGERRLRT